MVLTILEWRSAASLAIFGCLVVAAVRRLAEADREAARRRVDGGRG